MNMATLPTNIWNTPVFKENKDVKSTVKPKRKPLGTLTNHINSVSKTAGKNGDLKNFAKEIKFHLPENARSTAFDKAEKGTEMVQELKESPVEEKDWPEIEQMHLPPPSVDDYEDIWTLEEQPKAFVKNFLDWFPFDRSRRGRCHGDGDDDNDVFAVKDDGFMENMKAFDIMPSRSRCVPSMPRLSPVTEYVVDFPMSQ